MNSPITDRDLYRLLTFQSILSLSSDLFFIKDSQLRYIDSSRAFAELVGKTCGADLAGKTDFELFDLALATRYTADDRNVLDSGVPIVNHIEPLPDQDGKKKYASTSKHCIHDDSGRLIGIYGISRDVTAQIELEDERESRRLSRLMFEGVLEADLTADAMLRVEGSAWAHALGARKTETFSETINVLAEQFIHPDYATEFRQVFATETLRVRYARGETEFSHIAFQRGNSDDYKWMEFKSCLYYSRISNSMRITTILNDLDDEIRGRARLRHEAATDALTGLPNRGSVMAQITACLAKRPAEQTHVLLFIDLDGFKQINDTLGHPFGDKVLQKIAERLRMIFGQDDLLGRVGGDEFLVLLRNVANREDARRRTRRIFDMVPFYQFENGKEIYVTCSVGAAFYAGGQSFEQLYAEADRAMYAAKQAGKNRLHFACADESCPTA